MLKLICSASPALITCCLLDVLVVALVSFILYYSFVKPKRIKTPTETDSEINPKQVKCAGGEIAYIIDTDDYKPVKASKPNASQAELKVKNVSIKPKTPKTAKTQNQEDAKSLKQTKPSNQTAKPQNKKSSSVSPHYKPLQTSEYDEKIKNFKHKITKAEEINKTSVKPKPKTHPKSMGFEKSESLLRQLEKAAKDTDSGSAK